MSINVPPLLLISSSSLQLTTQGEDAGERWKEEADQAHMRVLFGRRPSVGSDAIIAAPKLSVVIDENLWSWIPKRY